MQMGILTKILIVGLLQIFFVLKDSNGLFFRKKVVNQLVNDPFQVKPDVITTDNLFGWMNLKNHVKFKLWTRKNPKLAQEIKVGNLETLHTSNFDPTKLTKLIVHGYAHSANEVFLEDWIVFLRDAFLHLGDFNVLIIDYTLFALPYLYWFSGPDLATSCLVDMIKFLAENGAKLEQFHLLGYSWGAHIAGNAGHKLNGEIGNPVIGRITGLDPANPTYRYVDNELRLDKSDAKFVDIIHTNGNGPFMEGYLGLNRALGHVDFYPNSGEGQPGCPLKWTFIFETLECDHSRSVLYFVESITSPLAFPACKCENWDKFISGNCPCGRENMTFMGEHISHSTRGIFYLFTKSKEPYGMGPKMDVSLPDIGESHDDGALLRFLSHFLFSQDFQLKMNEILHKRETISLNKQQNNSSDTIPTSSLIEKSIQNSNSSNSLEKSYNQSSLIIDHNSTTLGYRVSNEIQKTSYKIANILNKYSKLF